MNNHDATYWIEKLNLKPHPEGGFYAEVYRSGDTLHSDALPGSYSGDRSVVTSIYFLLRSGDVSKLHILKSDELWFHHSGSPIEVHAITEDGTHHSIVLSTDNPQAVIGKNTYFGSRITEENSYALVSCVVAPGFDFDDFEMPPRSELLALFPQHTLIIEQLT
ncbi:MAG: cupin domain-containing protein [Bacteroidota bacterium]